MADFKTRIDDLTGFGSTDDVAIADWLIAGAREIIDVLPMSKLDRMSEIQEFTSFQGVEDSKILHVLRKDENNSNVLMPCREIHASQSGRAADSNYMEFATSSDPVYYLENKRLYTLPASASSNDSKLVKINEDFTIVATDSTIDNFPKEATNAVVLYASRNALMRLMNAKHGNADITTGLTAINTEMDETQAVADLINTQVDAAITEIAEMAINVDANVDTALAAMNTAADKINTAIGLANTEFDKSNALLSLGESDTELDVNTALTAINTELDELQALADKIDTEVALINTQADDALTEIGLANAEIDKMATEVGLDNAEIDLARAEIAESAVLVDASIDTATAAIKTSVDKMNAVIDLANLEFDKAEGESDHAEEEADDSAVATALGLIKTQVDAAVSLLTADPGITDRLAAAEAAIDLAAAEIVLAKAEAAEIATQTDNAGDFETALDAINTELDKVDEIIVLASTEFDKVDNVIVEGSTQFDKTSQFLTDEDTVLVS